MNNTNHKLPYPVFYQIYHFCRSSLTLRNTFCILHVQTHLSAECLIQIDDGLTISKIIHDLNSLG